MGQTKKIKNDHKKDVCVMFSGGSDSSLTAYRMSLEFDNVHLLTFRHFGHYCIENSRKSYDLLAKKIPGKFKHMIIDINEVFQRIYYRKYFKNLLKYRTLQLQFTCFACQASFHVFTIRYCMENNIHHVRDGSNTEYEEASPMQMKNVKKEIVKLYADYNINHSSPVYHEYETNRSDYQLYRLGLREQENIKNDNELYQKYQGYCKFMPGSTIFLHYRKRCKKFPFDVQEKTLRHWCDEVVFLKSLIQEPYNK